MGFFSCFRQTTSISTLRRIYTHCKPARTGHFSLSAVVNFSAKTKIRSYIGANHFGCADNVRITHRQITKGVSYLHCLVMFFFRTFFSLVVALRQFRKSLRQRQAVCRGGTMLIVPNWLHWSNFLKNHHLSSSLSSSSLQPSSRITFFKLPTWRREMPGYGISRRQFIA